MKKIRIILAVILIAGSAVPAGVLFGASAFDYLPLEPIPGFNEAKDFPQYVSALYKFGIWTVGIAALLMLSIGGFMYMTSAGNNSRIEAAKRVIYDSLWGLVVAMFAWLLLFIINPDLVSGTLNFRKVKAGTYLGPAETAAGKAATGNIQNLAGNILNNKNINALATGADCPDGAGAPVTPKSNMVQAAAGQPVTVCHRGCGTNDPCRNNITLSTNLLAALVKISDTQSYDITSLAGGATHTVSSDHYKGKGVDIKPRSGSMEKLKNTAQAAIGSDGQAFCDSDGQPVADCSKATHVHISAKR